MVKVLEYSPAPFQLEDLDYLEDRDWSANWSMMGCFKTTTVEWLIERKLGQEPAPRVLIVTTKAGKGTYYQTLPKVLPGWTIYNVNSREIRLVLGEKEIPIPGIVKDRPAILITHYQVFSIRKRAIKDEDGNFILDKHGKKVMVEPKDTVVHRMLQMKWDMVILDEAHRIKERKTSWTKIIKKLDARYRHVMTGTGFINNPAEIWSLLHFLNDKLFSSYWHFRKTFCDEYIDDSGFKRILGVKREMKDDFRNLVRTIGPRRTMQEVFPDLEEPIFTPYPVELNDVQRRMYDQIKMELATMDQQGLPIYAPNVLAALNRLRQICVATPRLVEDYFDEKEQRRRQIIELVEPSSKLDALMEIIEGLEWDEERKDQIVVFSNFKDPIKLAKERFNKAGISYIHMEEKDSDQTRYQKWAIEYPKKEKQVFICTLQLGSESISLTSAYTAVFLDRSWSPLHNSQGISRIWRPGQTLVPNIINIDARDTVDKRVFDVNRIKNRWFKEIFGNEEE